MDTAELRKAMLASINIDEEEDIPHTDISLVVERPDLYLKPVCVSVCNSLWSKNIETYSSGIKNNKLFVSMINLSEANMKVFIEASKYDKRFMIIDGLYYLIVDGNSYEHQNELILLTNFFEIQDVVNRSISEEEYLYKYRRSKSKIIIHEDGSKESCINNDSLYEALAKENKLDCYVSSENCVYDSTLFLKWHNRYINNIKRKVKR